jgi:8-oxo-dGTP diphosphatase
MTTVTCHDIYANQHPTPTSSLQWRPAAYVVLIKDDSVCLLKANHGHYDLPGGAIELGEDPKSAAIREVKEETGLDLTTEPTLLGVESSLFRAVHSDDRCYHSLLMYYHCEEFSGEFSGEFSSGGFDEVERRLVEGAEWVPVARLDGIAVGSTVDFRPYVRQAYEVGCR